MLTVYLLAVVVPGVPFWVMCRKLGASSWLTMLVVIPYIGSIVLLAILANKAKIMTTLRKGA